MEVPQFRRCCCCLPLRFGLIAWGYFKIVLSGCLLIVIGSNLFFYCMYAIGGRYGFNWELLMILCIFIVLLCDVILSVIYLVGAHMKNPKLLRVFYFYSMFYLGLCILVFSITTCQEISFYYSISTRGHYERLIYVLMVRTVIGVFNFCLQIYLILLVRSEVIKLTSNCEFRFVNNAAEVEAKCVLNVKQNELNEVQTIEPTLKIKDEINT